MYCKRITHEIQVETYRNINNNNKNTNFNLRLGVNQVVSIKRKPMTLLTIIKAVCLFVNETYYTFLKFYFVLIYDWILIGPIVEFKPLTSSQWSRFICRECAEEVKFGLESGFSLNIFCLFTLCNDKMSLDAI